MSSRIWNTTKTRRGLKLVARLLRHELVFAAAILDHWPAQERHAVKQALTWIDRIPEERCKRKATAKRAGVRKAVKS